MKEILTHQNQADLTRTLAGRLTKVAHNSTLKEERTIFMREDQGDLISKPQGVQAEKIPTQVAEAKPREGLNIKVDAIKNPQYRQIAETSAALLQDKPLQTWRTADLRTQYLDWTRTVATLKRQGMSPADVGHFKLGDALLQELHKRGEKTGELEMIAAGIEGESILPIDSRSVQQLQVQAEANLAESGQQHEREQILEGAPGSARERQVKAKRDVEEKGYQVAATALLGSRNIDATGITHPDLLQIAEDFNSELGVRVIDVSSFGSWVDKVRQLQRASSQRRGLRVIGRRPIAIPDSEATQLIDRMKARIVADEADLQTERENKASIAEKNMEMRGVRHRDVYEKTQEYEEAIGTGDPRAMQIARDLEELVMRRIVEEGLASVESGRYPEELLLAASYFPAVRERLLSKIIFKPYEDVTERNQYRINLYPQGNLDTLLGFISRLNDEGSMATYRYYTSLQTAAEYFHGMNSRILAGNLDDFIRIAENISNVHFSIMQKVNGSAEVMRRYEEKYLERLAKNQTITTEDYEDIKVEVGKEIEALKLAGLLKSAYRDVDGNVQDITDWEVERAFHVGRVFTNITLRAAEQVASGRVPRDAKYKPVLNAAGNLVFENGHPKFEVEEEGVGPGGMKFASFPQESAVRILNWIQWLTYRFDISAARGGQEFLQDVKDDYFEFLRESGNKRDVNKITTLGGMNVEELEVAGIFGVSGVWSGWRIGSSFYSEIPIIINGQRTTIRQWRDDPDNVVKIDHAKEKKDERAYLEALRPLIENLNLGLGVLLKDSLVEGKIGYSARVMIWERVAATNLPIIMNYFKNIQVEKDEQGRPLAHVMSFDDILQDNQVLANIPQAQRAGYWNEPAGDGLTRRQLLERKFILRHERRIKIETGQHADTLPEIGLTREEAEVERIVKAQGRVLAPHLADIVFPYAPFLNDVPFEKLDWGRAGEEFYKRRMSSDLPSFSKAEGAFTAIMTNPGGLPPEKFLEQVNTVVAGLESPNGTPFGQDRGRILTQTWLEWVMTKKNQFVRQVFIKSLFHTFRKPTSKAQEKAGMKAQSIDEHQAYEVVEECVLLGIMTEEMAREFRRKMGLTLFLRMMAYVRDIFVAVPFILASKFTKKTTEGIIPA